MARYDSICLSCMDEEDFITTPYMDEKRAPRFSGGMNRSLRPVHAPSLLPVEVVIFFPSAVFALPSSPSSCTALAEAGSPCRDMAAARICRGSALHRLIYLVSFSPSVSVSVSQELTYYAHYWRRRSRIWSQTGCYYGGGRILDREEVCNSVCVDSPPFFRQFTTRTYAVGSNCAKARFDGESVASQMIKYAVTCRAQGKTDDDVS